MTALLDRGGTTDAWHVAKVLLNEFSTFRRVFNATSSQLRKLADEATCATIMISRRAIVQALRPEKERVSLANAGALEPYLMFDLADRALEEFRVFYLDVQWALLREETVSYGSVSECSPSVRAILARAIEVGSAGMIVVHNHPSGIPKPSDADFQFTRKLGRSAQSLDIRLLDHLIVTSTGTYSWREHGLL